MQLGICSICSHHIFLMVNAEMLIRKIIRESVSRPDPVPVKDLTFIPWGILEKKHMKKMDKPDAYDL